MPGDSVLAAAFSQLVIDIGYQLLWHVLGHLIGGGIDRG